MNGNRRNEYFNSNDKGFETTLNKQLRRIYLDQKRRRKAQENRRRFLKKWGYICSCCL